MDQVSTEVAVEVPHTLPLTNFTVPPGGDDFSNQEDFTALRILFLDLDGVLNSERTAVATGKIPFPSHGADDNGIKKVKVIDFDKFDPIGVQLINKLCHATSAVIVLSSSWRIGFTATEVSDMLQIIGIDSDLVFGKTISLSGNRGEEINHFLKNLQNDEGRRHLINNELLLPEFAAIEKVKVDTYAIVDDDQDMQTNQLPHFVHVNGLEGFSLSDAIYAGRILSKSEKFGLKNLGVFNFN